MLPFRRRRLAQDPSWSTFSQPDYLQPSTVPTLSTYHFPISVPLRRVNLQLPCRSLVTCTRELGRILAREAVNCVQTSQVYTSLISLALVTDASTHCVAQGLAMIENVSTSTIACPSSVCTALSVNRMLYKHDVPIMVSGSLNFGNRTTLSCEELKLQTGNKSITVTTMRKHQLVEGAVTKLVWSGTGPNARPSSAKKALEELAAAEAIRRAAATRSRPIRARYLLFLYRQ